MKIITQTSDQMALKDGNATGLIFGVVITIGAGFAAYSFYSTAGMSNQVWISIAVAVIGLIVLLTSASIAVNIDKTQNQIFFQKKRLIGTTSRAYSTQDVLRVELRKAFTGASSTVGTVRRQTLSYQSVIVLKDGSELPLENMKNSGSGGIGAGVLMGGTGKELSMSSQVANFLGVPFQEVGPGSAPTILGPGIGGI